jgi:hypothetical protein
MNDEQLMDTKTAINLHMGNAVAILKEDLVGLLARLEAAEAVCSFFDPHASPASSAGILIAAWRRAAGKE